MVGGEIPILTYGAISFFFLRKTYYIQYGRSRVLFKRGRDERKKAVGQSGGRNIRLQSADSLEMVSIFGKEQGQPNRVMDVEVNKN